MVEHSQLRNVAPGTLRLAVDKLPAPPDLAEGTCSCMGPQIAVMPVLGLPELI